MKFYVEEITVLKDGTSAVAITEKASEDECISAFHQAMASAMINPNVASIHVEAKNSLGGIYKSDTRIAKEDETTEDETTDGEVTETTEDETTE